MNQTHNGPVTKPTASSLPVQVDFLDGHSREEAIRLLDESLGDRARHSDEDLRVIAVVERHMENAKSQFPRSRKFLVEKRGEKWGVTVLDLDDLLHGGRDHELTFHVGTVNGQLVVFK